MQTNYDVVGIGSAIVDVLAVVEDQFIADNNLRKGSMELVSEERSRELYAKLGQSTECSGGSVANTLAGIASLGGRPAFIGKVRRDQLGDIFSHDMKSVGVHFDSAPTAYGPATASCLVCVTPDAQRTMNTYLGACTQLTEADIDESLIASSAVLYIEGYQWDMPAAKVAIRTAIKLAKKHGRQVALTLSDTFCVDRFREEFLALVSGDVDILFANEAELLSLFQTDGFEEALGKLQGKCEVALVTRSEKGAVVVTSESIEAIAGQRVEKVVDTTGAGDLFAAGFLYGYTRGWKHSDSVKLGNRSAAQIITHLGARSMSPLKNLLAA